jgi:hypothetical protein
MLRGPFGIAQTDNPWGAASFWLRDKKSPDWSSLEHMIKECSFNPQTVRSENMKLQFAFSQISSIILQDRFFFLKTTCFPPTKFHTQSSP